MNLQEVLDAIERVAGDDFCEELDMSRAAGGNYRLRGRIAVAADKLSRIYRLAHSFNEGHECYPVHGDWRSELKTYQESESGKPEVKK